MKVFDPLPAFQVRQRPQIFLGIDPSSVTPCWTQRRDSVGLVGPPGYGKTSGVIIPALMHWSGPAVVTSTRGDVLQATGDHRRRVAADLGGDVYVYDPLGSEGVGSIRWTPLAGCDDPTVVYRRVAEMTSTAGAGMADGDHWRTGAARIMRGVFFAAATGGRPLSEVRRWLARQDTEEPADLLRAAGPAAHLWADDLASTKLLGDRERSSFYSVALRTLEAVAEPRILASTEASDLDIDGFLRGSSTLYIVGPSHYQDALAPLIAGLVAAIADRASELAAQQGGQLQNPLLLALDEVSNIAPIRGLSGLTSEGGGRGINTLWATQTLDRLRARYGAEEAAAILGSSTAKLIFGGLSNEQDLKNFSSWEGEYREVQTTVYGGGDIPRELAPAPAGGLTDPRDTSRQHSQSMMYRPVLPIEAIRQMPPGEALLWYQSDPALRLDTRPAGTVPEYAALAGYTPRGGP